MKAVFFDRDGTLIENVPYNNDPSKVTLMSQARETLARLKEGGFALFVISNQSAVGRGWVTEADVAAVNGAMNKLLGEDFFKKFYLCYAAPEDSSCQRRKPSPEMILEAKKEYGVDLSQSFMIGDRLVDVECGRNAGCRSVWLPSGTCNEAEAAESRRKADFTAADLKEAADWILKQS
ncbi:MAG: HAD family hydrolase [bacterium]